MMYPEYWMPLLAYLLGSIPVGWIVARVFFKTDIRKAGSGNIGATNALRTFGPKVGIPVLLLDLLKGVAAVILARHLFGGDHPLAVLCGLLVILGHVFPVWLGFKGGKGVATAAGVFLAMSPLTLLFALIVFVAVVAMTKFVSLGSIIAALCLGLSILVFEIRSEYINWAFLILTVVVVLMIIVKHKANIKRLLQGNENKLSFNKKGKS